MKEGEPWHTKDASTGKRPAYISIDDANCLQARANSRFRMKIRKEFIVIEKKNKKSDDERHTHFNLKNGHQITAKGKTRDVDLEPSVRQGGGGRRQVVPV